ncbi:glycosyltransferase [Candidatus Margulisiibacteriota bacterium]
MKRPLISVILGSFNQKEVLVKVIDSFANQTMPADEYELVVVDSSSSDGSDKLLASFKPSCHFQYQVCENKGKTAARNKAIELAKSDIILITDADMIADKNLVKTHYLAHKNADKPTCFEGLTYNLTKLEWPTDRNNLSPYIKRNYRLNAKLGWWYFLTGNISLPKKVFFDANGFSEEFTGYGWEDLELGYRLSQNKTPLRYLKTAVNYHYHVITEEEEIERNINKGKSAKVFLSKHPGLKMFLGLNPLSIYIYRRIRKNGPVYNWFQNMCFKSNFKPLHKFGFWFLKEYNYLEGILS